MNKKRIIGHLDMDAFFASLEERDNPRFKGMPIAVGSDPKEGKGRGVVSTANYKAREYGVRSALPINIAWRYSQKAKTEGKPEVIFLPPDFSRYEKSSQNIHKIVKKYSSFVEQGSIDEFYFDLTNSKTYKKAGEVCQRIKDEIKKKERVTCSVGIGPNKLIAKISAGIKKPDGLFIVPEKDVEKFLENMSIRELPGIGPKTEQFLNEVNIKIIADIKKIGKKTLIDLLGKHGEQIYDKARGIDDSPLVEEREAKSISEQVTFETNTLDISYIIPALEEICENVLNRLKNEGFKTFKTISISVRYADFQTFSSAKTLKEPTNDKKTLKIESIKLLLPFLDDRKNERGKAIRLIGLRLEKLESR